MTISDAFREAADRYEGTLDVETEEAMEAEGYVFLLHESINDGPERAVEDWETLVENLGGEDAIEATYNEEGDPAFVVKHIASGEVKAGNGIISVLAELWLAVKKHNH